MFDLVGREVANPVNQKLDPGVCETRFDGTGLASGVYYYRLEVDESVQTGKFVLQK
ncbi:MAG: T9SS type A sorting domain-containing protein [Desulfobacterales bacterium]|nr:T9SS type A sorting domain-containing protein [Desulfobacterales bacterium]